MAKDYSQGDGIMWVRLLSIISAVVGTLGMVWSIEIILNTPALLYIVSLMGSQLILTASVMLAVNDA